MNNPSLTASTLLGQSKSQGIACVVDLSHTCLCYCCLGACSSSRAPSVDASIHITDKSCFISCKYSIYRHPAALWPRAVQNVQRVCLYERPDSETICQPFNSCQFLCLSSCRILVLSPRPARYASVFCTDISVSCKETVSMPNTTIAFALLKRLPAW